VNDQAAVNTLKDLRRARRTRRTAELEWFEVAYRVYLVAFVAGTVVFWASGFVEDTPVTAAGLLDVRAHTPALGGLLAALGAFLGLRSGARGGPVALEEAEIRHVLMAPVPHAAVLRPPTIQRSRSLVGTGALAGAVVGELAARRLPGSTGAWMLSTAAAGALVALIYVICAVVAHGRRIGELVGTAIGAALIAVQVAVLAGWLPAGPFDTIGSLALWPVRVRLVDLAAPIVLLAAFVAALAMVERFSLELMTRRSALVAQLRFAVTMQDLRTVMLLRRQLSLEQNRERPWFKLGRRGPAVFRRSARSLVRFPARRLGRMALFSATAGVAEVYAFRGTSPLFLVAGLATFLLGLEAVEPLAQELDHPDLTGSYPLSTGRLHQLLLSAPGVALVLFSVPGLLAATVLEPRLSTLGVGAVLAVPAALLGGCGAVLNTIDGAPDPFSSGNEGAMLPPEVAGIHLVFRLVRPPLIACLGTAPVLLVRAVVRNGEMSAIGVAARCALGLAIVGSFVVWWVEKRLAFRIWWRNAMAESKQRPNRPGATA
jgi:hypothetical protein